MPQTKDILEKTLEAYDDVFADICNALLFKGRQLVRPSDLRDAQPFSYYKAENSIRAQDRDVAKYWNKFAIRIALFGMENQSKVFKFMPLRVISYDGAAYRAQLNEDTDPKYPVVTIVLYFGKERWRNRNLFDCIELPDELRPFVNDYRINVFEICYLTEDQIGYFQSDFKVLADYFVHSLNDPNYRPKDPQKFKHAAEVLELLSVFADERFGDLVDAEGGLPGDMCEVFDRAVQQGVVIGEEKGRAAGILIGEERGRAAGILYGARRAG